MNPFKTLSEEEIQKINRMQRELFDELYHMFEPPLPEGVPERLQRIAGSGEIAEGETVLDVGSGTGILIPHIRKYNPGRIYACDLSDAMLKQLVKNDPQVVTILSDVRDMTLPDSSIDVVFINACYPNLVDKKGAFSNMARMMRPGGRMVISHPLGKAFIEGIRDQVPFPLDPFPEQGEADELLGPFGFTTRHLVDEPKLYILVAVMGGTAEKEEG
jgi:ubiquinone/menaquinone biosynthesis C-methylase UbiE